MIITTKTPSSSSSAVHAAVRGGGGGGGEEVDPVIWRGAAGAFIQIPKVGARVYYFPQGHFEQCLTKVSSSPGSGGATSSSGVGVGATSAVRDFCSGSSSPPPPAFFLCRVVSVRFMAHVNTDQPFACVRLVPIRFGDHDDSSPPEEEEEEDADVIDGEGGYYADASAYVSKNGDGDDDVSKSGRGRRNRSDSAGGDVSRNGGGYDTVASAYVIGYAPGIDADVSRNGGGGVYNRDVSGSGDVSSNKGGDFAELSKYGGYNRKKKVVADVSRKVTYDDFAAAAELSKHGGFNNNRRKYGGDADVTKCGYNRCDDITNYAYNNNNNYNHTDFASGDVSRNGGGYKRKENGVVVADVSSGGYSNVEEKAADVVCFTKVLTPSDANNGGGFSVPRFCADSIFPPLDFDSDPPVQNLVMRDIHGVSFGFRHIYRGTPRRHLLTTGWSKFVNSKKLVAGDSVVFMRKRRTGALYLGVRRALRGGDVAGSWNGLVGGSVKSKEDEWSVGKGVVVDSVLESLEKAVRGMEFEVVFYPRVGWSEFIVKAESVEKAIGMLWMNGMRVKMAVESEDSTRTTWHTGIVSSATVPEHGPWRGSPWRMLEVTWDESQIMQHINRVNSWQVERVASAGLYAAFPPTKKIRGWEEIRMLPSQGEVPIPNFSFINSPMAPLTTSYPDYTIFPASMQGARQIQDSGSFLYKFLKDGTEKMNSDEITDNDMQLKLGTLSTELNIGSLPSDTSSVDNSNCFNGTGAEGKQDSSSSTKVVQRPIQLFGKIIGMEKPAEDSSGNEECSS